MAKVPPFQSSSSPQFGSDKLWCHVKEVQEELINQELWEEIRQATKTNVTLQDEFERLKVIFLLSKGGADGG